MPHNKEQHFVPFSYLKNFSSNKKTIHLHNLSNQRTIFNAKLKTQCRREYLYGKEDLSIEKGLGLIEGAAANAFRNISSPPRTPTPGNIEFAHLITFAIFQHHRTIYAARALNEMFSNTAKKTLSYDPRFSGGILENVDIGLTNPAILATQSASRSLHFGLDLSCKLLLAKEGCEFITSDNPAIFYNQALEISNYQGLGLACKGLQIFLPISPERLLLFYDSKIYKVGLNNLDPVQITEQSDMDQINSLILANADENIYFLTSDKINLKVIGRGIRHKLINNSTIETHQTFRDGEAYSDLLISKRIRPRTGLKLNFVREHKTANLLRATADNNFITTVELCRDPDLVVWDQLYEKSLEKGNTQNFFEFIASQG
ncbi:hypothetical protein PMI35_01079 [Pseudomonas sp. GM78]|uniref:DUF4238 domain-containing protein n=1 Tax=Pseudomonas sp. GM78 TaxID=1144337 RepID=UPI00026F62DE|nr:DUF4238 domain-containing protein [Pseudomonas sp. GM78]EJN32545.1 hypothetical protein PMI35_01079 [Pseudomonas sp. GM78]